MADEKKLYTADVIAKIFNFENVRRIDQLVQDGILKPELVMSGGKQVRRYDLIPTIRQYIAHLQERARGRVSASTDAGKEQAELDTRYKKAKTEKIELELSELKGQMHRAEDIEMVMGDMVSGIRAELMALPGRLAVDTAKAVDANETSAIIKDAVMALLDDLSKYQYDPAKYAVLVRDREKWMDRMDRTDDQDAPPAKAKTRTAKTKTKAKTGTAKKKTT